MSRPCLIHLWIVLVAFFCLIAPRTSQAGQEPFIQRVIVTNTTTDLLVYFDVDGAFASEEIRQAIFAGIPTTFTYQIELIEVRRVRRDATIIRLEVKRIIKYDPVAQKFAVTDRGHSGETATTNDWSRAQQLMTDISGLRIIPLAAIERGATYRLRIRALIHKPKLPPVLSLIFFFVPLGDIETEWYEVAVRR
ncbi:MAG: DUF4390 domain-containing protein [Deltaproteobacteria bacterium]|nr:DUF4390 domain-containing protein [Deltaproteobacteria bacterium]